MHNWGDESVDWDGINAAAKYIYMYLKRWRVPVRDFKEKYGTVRVYCSLHWERGWLLMHLLRPGHMFWRFPRWLRTVDYWFPTHWLNAILVPFYKFLYTRAYGNALRKWPHLRSEILQGADYSELLGRYGVHRIRTSERGYEIHYDWHPDNWKSPTPEENPDDSETI